MIEFHIAGSSVPRRCLDCRMDPGSNGRTIRPGLMFVSWMDVVPDRAASRNQCSECGAVCAIPPGTSGAVIVMTEMYVLNSLLVRRICLGTSACVKEKN